MDSEWLKDVTLGVKALTALLSTAGAGAMIRAGARWVEAQRTRKAMDSFELGVRTHAILHQLMEELGGHRAVILEAHNSGGDLSVQKPLYTSVRYQARDKNLPKVHWVNEPVDEGYWDLLMEVHRSTGVVHKESSKLLEESTLRQLYESQGILGSFVFPLFALPTGFWYCSINYSAPPGVSDASAAERCRSAKGLLVRTLRDLKTP